MRDIQLEIRVSLLGINWNEYRTRWYPCQMFCFVLLRSVVWPLRLLTIATVRVRKLRWLTSRGSHTGAPNPVQTLLSATVTAHSGLDWRTRTVIMEEIIAAVSYPYLRKPTPNACHSTMLIKLEARRLGTALQQWETQKDVDHWST